MAYMKIFHYFSYSCASIQLLLLFHDKIAVSSVLSSINLMRRKHNQTETLNSMDEPGALKVLSRRESWDYQDIEVYDIIRDVLPQLSEQTGTSTFQPQDGSSASNADCDKNKCLKSSCDAIDVKQLDPVHLEGSDSSSDETVYDDVINTCPIYQNFGSRSPLADLTDEIWSSRVDVLY